MKGVELYNQLINWPGPMELAVMFGVALAMIAVAAILLAIGKVRLFARIIGAVGVVIIMLALFVILEQTTKEKIGPYITVTRFRNPELIRQRIRIALFGLPAAAAIVMTTVLTWTRRRLRSTVPGHLKEGRKLLAQGQFDAALAQINTALEISPYLGEAYYQRGCVFMAKDKNDEAMADFSHALRCDPQLAHAYLQRGRLRTEKGEFDAALADFDQVMIMRPNDAECYLNRGVCLARKGLPSDAALDFRRVLKLTNHSDYADPARFYLDQLTNGPSSSELPSPPSSNGSGHTPSTTPSQPPSSQDYML